LKNKEVEDEEKTEITNTKSHKERLIELRDLLSEGLLTEEEYEKKRSLIVNDI
jgi:cytochrome c-type biogenesis protein CcmH/NrfG